MRNASARRAPAAYLLLLGVLAGVTACSGSNARLAAQSCRIEQMRVLPGPDMSPTAGQNPVTVTLKNRLSRACRLEGYPSIALFDARGHELHFSYSHAGDQMITSRKPKRITVRRGGSAYFVFNKFRCDLRATRVSTVSIRLPGGSGTRSLSLRGFALGGYCTPFQTVTVSPIVSRFRDVLAHA